jgi:hypothetical protein
MGTPICYLGWLGNDGLLFCQNVLNHLSLAKLEAQRKKPHLGLIRLYRGLDYVRWAKTK